MFHITYVYIYFLKILKLILSKYIELHHYALKQNYTTTKALLLSIIFNIQHQLISKVVLDDMM